MSLSSVLNQPTIKLRYQLLSNYLKQNICSELNDDDTLIFKDIVDVFYNVDDGEVKYDKEQIKSVRISLNKFKSGKNFEILVGDVWYPTSIKRLAGSKITNTNILKRAMRECIVKQILEFKKQNPLNPEALCEITNKPLGFNVEIDHIIPFHILADEWLENNKKATCKYDLSKFNYVLDKPYYDDWYNFHLCKAKLRYLSPEGNRVAHLYYKS
jgi:hypothetical protein